MENSVFRKALVIGIIVCFIGAGVLPICSASMNVVTAPVVNEKQVYKLNKNIIPSQFSHESEIEYGTTTVEKSDNEKIKSTSGVLNNGDILDQQQTTQETGAVLSGTYSWAQSFKPTLGTLTRIELLLSKWGEQEHDDIRVYIRSSLTGSNLASDSIAPYQIRTNTFDWIEVDFEDIAITPGKTYYIICETTGGYPVDPGYSYSWGCSESDVYQNGDGWFLYTEGGSWRKWTPLMDMCFKTYAILPLEITSIRGGFGVSAILTNTGSSDINNIDWSITLTGKVFMGSATGGTIDTIPADSTKRISSGLVFGFGPVDINVTASVKTASATGYAIGPFVIGVSQKPGGVEKYDKN